ncbi:immunoglobulin iota chain [Eulemur rufifrons]|uniref:immunoglobulin iota chain n=1 Tax=Eulemur rufifrons TaxID=859984 RepID=UPI0037425053
MSRTPVLLLLLAHCTGCGLHLLLHQPPTESAFLGTTVRLACTLSSDHNIGVYSVFWYQQRPGHPPRFLLRYFSHSDKNQGPKVPPRFSGFKDVARNRGYLSISELQPEDEAVYFCAVGAQSMEKEVDREGDRQRDMEGDRERDREGDRERGEEKEAAAPQDPHALT